MVVAGPIVTLYNFGHGMYKHDPVIFISYNLNIFQLYLIILKSFLLLVVLYIKVNMYLRICAKKKIKLHFVQLTKNTQTHKHRLT